MPRDNRQGIVYMTGSLEGSSCGTSPILLAGNWLYFATTYTQMQHIQLVILAEEQQLPGYERGIKYENRLNMWAKAGGKSDRSARLSSMIGQMLRTVKLGLGLGSESTSKRERKTTVSTP